MYEANMQTLHELIIDTYNSKVPLMIYGGPGIGKSETILSDAQYFAEKEKRKFVEWNKATLEEKANMIDDPDPYFVFADQRVAQMDPTDLRGIPNMVSGKEWLETIPMSWVVYFTQPKAHGIIFFDEINLAPPMVAAQAYQIINERAVADRALSPFVHIVAAGNRISKDKAYVFEMPLPLRDRFAEVEITHDVDSWVTWATQHKINSHLIAFINWKNSLLYHIDEKSVDKSSTPRSITRASKLIGDYEITSNKVHQLVAISCGIAFATQFQAYTKHFAELNWNKIYSTPTIVKDFSVDKLWAVAGGLAENYNKKMDTDGFNKTIKVIKEMKTDFAICTLRMIRDLNAAVFTKLIRKHPEFQSIATKYGKYIID